MEEKMILRYTTPKNVITACAIATFVLFLIFGVAFVGITALFMGYDFVDALEDGVALVIFLATIIAGLVFALIIWASKLELVVTDKRIYCHGFLGKRVDIPVTAITATSMSTFIVKRLCVASPNGRISCWFVDVASCQDVHDKICNLLIQR